MKCPFCDADIDNNLTECPYCGKLITSNIHKQVRQFEKTMESRDKKINGFVENGKGRISELGSKGVSALSSNKKLILWILGWIFIFPVPALILILGKRNKKMNDVSKAVLSIVIVLIYIIIIVSIGTSIARKSAPSSKSERGTASAEVDDSIQKLRIPVSSEEVKNLGADEACALFEQAGFSNIEKEEVYDIDPDANDAQSLVEILVSGQAEYKKDDEVPKDAQIKCVTHYPFNKYTMNVSVDFIPNIIFDTYNVDFVVDGETQETIQHGNDATYTLRLKEGDHTLSFCKNGSSTVKGEAKVNVTSDIDVGYKISCHGDRVDVETTYTDVNKELPEDEAKIDCGNSDFYGKNYQDIVNKFRDLGFTDIKVAKMYDIVFGVTKKGSVEYVTIGGSKDYKHGDIFKKDTEVIIAYHLPVDEDPASATPTPTSTPKPTATPAASNTNSAATSTNSTATETKETEPKTIHAEATTKVKVRKEPNTNCDVLGMLEEGDRIEVIDGKDDEWGHVKYEGQEGYVKNEYLKYDSAGGTSIDVKEYQENKDKERKEALSKLKSETDKVSGVTFYKPKEYPKYTNVRTFFLPYLATKGEVRELHLKANYYGGSWVFWDKIIVAVDDERYELEPGWLESTSSDIDDVGNVVEQYDFSNLSTSDIAMLRKISISKETIIRFQGSDKKYDLTVKKADKQAIADVLDAYYAY